MDRRMAEYRTQGYTVFEGLYDETTMQAWRDEQDRLQTISTEGPDVREPTTWFGNMLEQAPQLMWPAVAHPAILDFAEHTDTFTGPNCQQLINWARSQQDHPALRLLGQDEHLQSRANSGFLQPDEVRWHQWAQDDQCALEEVTKQE